MADGKKDPHPTSSDGKRAASADGKGPMEITTGDLVKRCHNPSLAQKEGMVTQIWEDGEITSQEAGRLLWWRGLHRLYPPLTKTKYQMPMADSPGHSYAFVEHEDALRIRAQMCQESGERDEYSPYGAAEELAARVEAAKAGKAAKPETVVGIVRKAVLRCRARL